MALYDGACGGRDRGMRHQYAVVCRTTGWGSSPVVVLGEGRVLVGQTYFKIFRQGAAELVLKVFKEVVRVVSDVTSARRRRLRSDTHLHKFQEAGARIQGCAAPSGKKKSVTRRPGDGDGHGQAAADSSYLGRLLSSTRSTTELLHKGMMSILKPYKQPYSKISGRVSARTAFLLANMARLT